MGHVRYCEGYPSFLQLTLAFTCCSLVTEGDTRSALNFNGKLVFICICIRILFVFLGLVQLPYLFNYHSVGVEDVGTMDSENTLSWRRYLGSITNYVQSMIPQYVTSLFVHSVNIFNQIYIYYFKVSWLQYCFLHVYLSITLFNFVSLVHISYLDTYNIHFYGSITLLNFVSLVQIPYLDTHSLHF
jgi:hypothetical protein